MSFGPGSLPKKWLCDVCTAERNNSKKRRESMSGVSARWPRETRWRSKGNRSNGEAAESVKSWGDAAETDCRLAVDVNKSKQMMAV